MNSNQIQSASSKSLATRRDFLKTSGKVVAAAALARAIEARSYAAEDNTIKIALIGCGGRGGGAAVNALSTAGPTKLWTMADVFSDRLQFCLKNLAQGFTKQVDVTPDRSFVGLDAYKQAMDTLDKGDVVLLATPPGFRPIHFEYAVQKGLNVFMEKSFAVDGPGVRRVMRTGELAQQKNLKVAGGLMWRHCPPRETAIRRMQEGALGKIITSWAYRMHGPVGVSPRQPGMNELAYQIKNYSCFTWLNGSFIVDWLIHDIDVCCWIKESWPVSVQGQGGRQVRAEADQLFDHYAAEYSFGDGTRLFAQGRHMTKCWEFFGNVIHGAAGSAVMMEGGDKRPRFYRGHEQTDANLMWEYDGPLPNPYQVEHDLLFDAIRNNKPYNETERCAKSCMTAIMGRMACESGETVTWEQALNSKLELAPGLDNVTWDSPAPVMPDANGRYPVARPGQTQAL